jgi:hypothetical protein
VAIKAKLRPSVDATQEEFDAAWTRMVVDLSGHVEKDDVVLSLAVEGVRARLEENLRLTRHYASVVGVYDSMCRTYDEYQPIAPDKADVLLTEFKSLAGLPGEPPGPNQIVSRQTFDTPGADADK